MIPSSGNIRDYLGPYINKRVIDITQNDSEDFNPADPKTAYIEFLFEDGATLRFYTLPCEIGPAFSFEHADGCTCDPCKEGESN